jgi:hypothetical protein
MPGVLEVRVHYLNGEQEVYVICDIYIYMLVSIYINIRIYKKYLHILVNIEKLKKK